MRAEPQHRDARQVGDQHDGGQQNRLVATDEERGVGQFLVGFVEADRLVGFSNEGADDTHTGELFAQ